MSDEALRQLEKATRESPADAAAGRRFAHALERAGDRRGAYLELLRLARQGDAEARGLIDSFFALPLRSRLEDVRPTNRAPVPETATETWARFSFSGFPAVIAATERALFIRGLDCVAAIDTSDLRERWRVTLSHEAPATMCGPDVVAGDGNDLILLDGDCGRELARARTLGTVAALTAEWDRACAFLVANAGRMHLLAGFDTGQAFGRMLWKRIHPLGSSPERDAVSRFFACKDGVVYPDEDREAFRLEDGTHDPERSRRARFMGDTLHFWPLQGAKSIKASGKTFWVTQEGREGVVVLLAPAAGETERGQRPPTQVAVLPLLRRSRSPSTQYSRRPAVLAVARSVLYVLSGAAPMVRSHGAWAISNGADFANLTAIDTATGRILLDRNLETDLSGEFHTLEFVALEQAVLVAMATPGGLAVVRIG